MLMINGGCIVISKLSSTAHVRKMRRHVAKSSKFVAFFIKFCKRLCQCLLLLAPAPFLFFVTFICADIDELTIDLEELAPPRPLPPPPSTSTSRTVTSKDGAGDPEKKSSKSKVVDMCITGLGPGNSNKPHFLDRSWKVIYNCSFLLQKKKRKAREGRIVLDLY